MSFPALKHVVIVGGGLAGARCCEQLRRQGHEGRITLVGAEQHAPYDRPPLSKDVLLDKRDETSLDIDFEALSVNARLGVAATGLRAVDRVLCTTTGEVPYDGLIIATGADPVRLPGDGPQWTVRTLEDAIAVRSRLTPGARVVLIGASWIGAEIASAALARGCEVTCLEAGDAPLAAALGSAVGARLLPWWDGVDLRLNSPVERVADGGVLLADGAMVPADLVVSGVGVRPVTGWLHGSELEADCGVVVDEWLRAAPGVVAVGDVAAWWSRRWGRRMRVEHWDDAASGPSVAVAALLRPSLCDVEPHDPVPYFWSDQFGHKLQYVGAHCAQDRLVWRSRDNGGWTAAWLSADGRLTAALVADLPREMAQARLAILRDAAVDPGLLADAAVPLTKAVVAA